MAITHRQPKALAVAAIRPEASRVATQSLGNAEAGGHRRAAQGQSLEGVRHADCWQQKLQCYGQHSAESEGPAAIAEAAQWVVT